MSDELSADHPQVRVLLISMRDIAIGAVFGIGRRMKRVTRRMHADKSHSAAHGVQQHLLAFERHWRLAVRAQRREVAGGEKYHGGVGEELFRIKNASVLGHAGFESVLISQLADRVIDETRLPLHSFHYGMFESRRFCKNQNRFVRCSEQAS